MPGMMSTVLNLGLTEGATAALGAETGDPRFALDSRLRFLLSFAAAVYDLDPDVLKSSERETGGMTAGNLETRLAEAAAGVAGVIRGESGQPVPDDAARQLQMAVAAVFASWDTPRARTYRELNEIPHGSGTAVTVQAMVFGNRDDRSGTGVAFSRNPNTGENVPFGEVLFGSQGEDIVSGRTQTLPLHDLAEREPGVWAQLLRVLATVEGHYRDACYVEFTYETGSLWILQVRPCHFVGSAAVRVAVDLVEEGKMERPDAVLRILPQSLGQLGIRRMDSAGIDLLTRGQGACPGVASGRLAVTADAAVRLADDGAVILVRTETSPLDMHGLAASAGILTARGGPASHAAVVARAMGKPAVVGAADLMVDVAAAVVRTGGRTLPEGTLITIDGTSGEVAAGNPRIVTDAVNPYLYRLLDWADEVSAGASDGAAPGSSEAARLAAGHRVLQARGRSLP
jgi:pyruvate,orthophosphate dikinase